jgi:hypothetical protein
MRRTCRQVSPRSVPANAGPVGLHCSGRPVRCWGDIFSLFASDSELGGKALRWQRHFMAGIARSRQKMKISLLFSLYPEKP